MRVIRIVGVMLVAGLLWLVIGALLKSLGLGIGAIACAGVVILFVLGPVISALASGGKPSPTESAKNSSDSDSARKEKL